MQYNIVTYCSRSYTKKFKKTIQSWQKQNNVKNIFVYTDRKEKDIGDKTIFIEWLCDPGVINDFGTNCARKAESLLNILNYKRPLNHEQVIKDNENVLLLDIDCFILQDLNNLFSQNFDIAITVYPNKKEKNQLKNISSGFLALKNNEKTKNFVEQWINRQNELDGPCRDQQSLSELIYKNHKNNGPLKILKLPYEEYNLHPMTGNKGDILNWIDNIITHKKQLKILHCSSSVIDNPKWLNRAMEFING